MYFILMGMGLLSHSRIFYLYTIPSGVSNKEVGALSVDFLALRVSTSLFMLLQGSWKLYEN
jgi:hypothetical protein